jgi:hypothetical protein
MNKKGSPTFQNTTDKKIHPYMTPPTLAGKKGVTSMGVPEPQEKDLSKREESCDSCEKVAKESINTSNMSKFLFDKLFEDVMSGSEFGGGDDAADLGIDVGDESGEDLGGGDEVTITLDRATAEKLIDLIQGAMGGLGEEEGEEEGELDGEGGEEAGGGEEEEGAMGESIEVVAEPKPFGAKAETLQKRDNKVSSKYKAAGGKAHTGSIAPLQAEPKAFTGKAETLQNKNNKVAGFSTSGTIFGS